MSPMPAMDAAMEAAAPPPPLEGVKYRFVTHNLWGVSVRNPMTRPTECCAAMMTLAAEEGWHHDPLVIAMQEVYAFRMDPISHAAVAALDWVERRAYHALQYFISIALHIIIILANAVIPKLIPAFNYLRFTLLGIPQWIYDVKPGLLPQLQHLIDQGTMIGHNLLTFASDDLLKAGDAGILLLASGGLRSCTQTRGLTGFVPFTHGSGSESMSNRGCLWMVLKEQRVAVVSTHMQAVDDPLRFFVGDCAHRSVTAQTAQVRALVKELEERADVDYVFLMGDLNTMNATAAEVEARFGMFKLNLDTHTHRTDGCIDHVLCSKHIPAERVRARHIETPSDHHMVVVELL